MYGYGEIIHEGKELFRANITLRNTKPSSVIDSTFLFAFQDGIYDASFVVHQETTSLTLSDTSFELGIRDQKTGLWKGYLSYENMKEFLEQWNILDRRVLIEKYKSNI